MVLQPFNYIQAFIERLSIYEQTWDLTLSSYFDQSSGGFVTLMDIAINDILPSR